MTTHALVTLRRSAVAGWVLLGGVSASAAHAQDASPPSLSRSIDVQRYKPGPNTTDLLGLHGARVGNGWHFSASLTYAHRPLGLFVRGQATSLQDVVATQTTLDVMGSFSCERFELGVDIPLTSLISGRGVPVSSSSSLFQEGVSGSGLGDLRWVPKARLFSLGGWHLGAVSPVVMPTAKGESFRGGAGLALQPQLVSEWTMGGGARLMANMGIHLRKQERLYNLLTGNEWLYAVGAELPLSSRLAVQTQIAGALGLAKCDAEERPLELFAAMEYRLHDLLRFHVGGGLGLSHGYGTPRFRLLAGIGWSVSREQRGGN